MKVDTFKYDNRIVRAFAIATVIWGIVGMSVGLLAAIQLFWPQANLNLQFTSFGRVRPLHTNAVIFAFVGNGMFMGIYYSLQRLCKARMFSDALSWINFWGWQAIIVGAAITLPSGLTTSKEYAELEWPIDIAITVVWVAFTINLIGTILKRREKHLYAVPRRPLPAGNISVGGVGRRPRRIAGTIDTREKEFVVGTRSTPSPPIDEREASARHYRKAIKRRYHAIEQLPSLENRSSLSDPLTPACDSAKRAASETPGVLRPPVTEVITTTTIRRIMSTSYHTSPGSGYDARMHIRKAAFIAVFVTGLPLIASAQSDEADRIKEAGVILGEIMAAPDKAIPGSVLEKAEAIAIFPSTIKGAFIVGAQRGKGIISVRDRAKGTWSSPAFMTLTGGSVGFQIGGQAVDIVLVVQNRRGVENLLQNQFEIGGEASATAGPVGRDTSASTDIQLRAEILSYSRSRGLFAGVSLRGAALRQDQDSNQKFYGSRFRTRDVVLDGKATMPQAPDAVSAWLEVLGKNAK